MEMATCTQCGQAIDGLECAYCGSLTEIQGPYQLICHAYYCGWKSDIVEDYKEIECIEKCPRCGVVRGPKLQLVTV